MLNSTLLLTLFVVSAYSFMFAELPITLLKYENINQNQREDKRKISKQHKGLTWFGLSSFPSQGKGLNDYDFTIALCASQNSY